MAYYKADVWNANYSKVGVVSGSTIKELKHNFTKWKRENKVPVNSKNYMLVDITWVEY